MPKRILATRDERHLQADTESEIDEAIEHYRAQGWRVLTRGRQPGGEYTATLEASHA